METTQTSEMMETLAREAAQVVGGAIKSARKESEAEAKKMLQQYEQKTRQIALKIREDTKSRAAEIADKIRETIMLKVEKASADVMAEAIAESTRKVEALGQERQELAGKEAERASVIVSDDARSEAAQPVDKLKGKAVAEDKKNGGPKAEPAARQEGVEVNSSIEGFDQWLAD
jgi:DNA-binding protein